MSFTVSEEEAGERLDRSLARRLERSRNQIQRWIEEGRVTWNGRPARASRQLRAGDVVTVEVPEEPRDAGIEAEHARLDVLFEDEDVVVVAKPAGLAVHPGAGRESGTLAHRLLGRYPEMAGVGGARRPGIVHRLDQGTTGAMVVARNERSYLRLAEAFAERRVKKEYLAIVYGAPRPPSGTIDLALGRHPRERKKMAVRAGGRPAQTRYRTCREINGLAWLEIELLTGRTHQIRVHLKTLGHPLVGDPVYGEARWRALPGRLRRPLRLFPRPALHAWRLAFEHPQSGETVAFEAPVPDDLADLWRQVTGEEVPR